MQQCQEVATVAGKSRQFRAESVAAAARREAMAAEAAAGWAGWAAVAPPQAARFPCPRN